MTDVTNTSLSNSSTVRSTLSSSIATSTHSSSTVTTSATTFTSTATATVTAASSSTSPASTPISSMAQTARVVFDDAYKQGTMYVLPSIQKLNVNVYQETNVETPQDPAMPYKTKTHAMQVDEAKLTSGQDKLKGDQDEACVLKLLYEQLQKATQPGDTPVFLFCSLMLSNHEKDIVVFHRKYGVIIVEVKGVGNPRSFSRLQKAAEQLLKARDAIRTELQGLLAPDAVTLLMALPNLTDAGNAQQSMQILRDNPDIQLLCGREEADYKTFLQQLPTRPDPLVWKAQPDSHQAFVTAVSRYLSVEVYMPTETASELAQVHRSWLLTPVQAPFLHSHHRLLHLWGPPGAGKTLLLLHRVKLWLQDNKHVILCVGSIVHSMLLQHLGRAAVSGDGGRFSHNLTLCRNYYEFQKTVEELGVNVSPDNVCVVVDEVVVSFLFPTLKAFQEHKVFCLWTASMEDIPDTESATFLKLGGEKVLLPSCLRCPPHVVEVAGKVLQATPLTPAMTSFPYLPATMPTASIKVCIHPSHHGYIPLGKVSDDFDCGVCSQWLRSSLSPLVEGLPLQHPQWRHWVIVYTGDYSDLDKRVESKLMEWLRNQGMPAVSEMEEDFKSSNLPVSVVQQGSQDQGSGVRDESAKWRERVVRGLDRHGNTAVHFVPHDLYTGMEKPCVMVLHWDGDDDRSDHSHRDDRERRHREAWFQAMTRCQAELCVWLVSPSPAASCLPLSLEEMEWCRQEEQWIQEEERIQEEEQVIQLKEQIQEEQRLRREDELAQWKCGLQERRERLDEKQRLSQKEMEWCRQEEQRILEKQRNKERLRSKEELECWTWELKERRRCLEVKQRRSREEIEWCRWEEQRIQGEEQRSQREEQLIREEQRIQEEERRGHEAALRQIREALRRHDVATAQQIQEARERRRRELERQHEVQQKGEEQERQHEAQQTLKEIKQQLREKQERQCEARQKRKERERQRREQEEEQRRRESCVIQ